MGLTDGEGAELYDITTLHGEGLTVQTGSVLFWVFVFPNNEGAGGKPSSFIKTALNIVITQLLGLTA